LADRRGPASSLVSRGNPSFAKRSIRGHAGFGKRRLRERKKRKKKGEEKKRGEAVETMLTKRASSQLCS